MADLKKRLLSEGRRYSFVQAYRLLSLLILRDPFADEGDVEKRILSRPDLSLDFPGTDIISISEDLGTDPERYSITATFLGLYGVSSPLPTFYTEDLLQEASEDRTIVRDFLDFINQPLYHLFFKCWARHRLFHGVVEKASTETLERMFCLIGFSSPSLKECFETPYSLLRYIGLATQTPRSAEGLRSLLADALSEPTVRIEQCVPRVVDIPEDQRLSLGVRAHCLGETSYCGSKIDDFTGQFRVRVGPISEEGFQTFLPDKPLFQKVRSMIRFYLDQPFSWDLQVAVERGEIKMASLGDMGTSRLGWNTWLSFDEPPEENLIRFVPSGQN